MLRLRYYTETGQADEAKHYEQYLRETGQYRETASLSNGPSDLHAEYRSGRLAKRLQRENTNEREATEAEQVSLPRAFAQSAAATGANLAQGIPGMEAAQAYIMSKTERVPYRDALGTLRGETNKIPTALKYGERIAGALPLASILPGSAVASGAIVGGADQALSADPDMSLTERGFRTVAGAAGGAVLGKVTDAATTGLKAAFTRNPASTLLARQAERAASARKLYGAALQEGRNNGTSTEVQAFVKEPMIADIVDGLRQTDEFANTAADAPEMLDAIYKTLSDQAGKAKRGLDALTPAAANQGRFRLSDIRGKQQRLLGTMEAPTSSSVSGSMPSYPKAVQDFAQRTREIEAIQKGYDALRGSLSDNLPTAKNLTRKTPEAFAEWAAKATPEEVQAAREGVLGATKMAIKPKVNPFGLFGLGRPAGKASSLLRDANTPSQAYLEVLQNLGLLTAGNASSP